MQFDPRQDAIRHGGWQNSHEHRLEGANYRATPVYRAPPHRFVWVERPEEINARFSEYLGRPFYLVGIKREWQEEQTYSLNALTCLHWGAVASSLNQRAGETAKVDSS